MATGLSHLVFFGQILKREWTGNASLVRRGTWWSKVLYALLQCILSPFHAIVMVVLSAGRDVSFQLRTDASRAVVGIPEWIKPFLEVCDNSRTSFDIPFNR